VVPPLVSERRDPAWSTSETRSLAGVPSLIALTVSPVPAYVYVSMVVPACSRVAVRQRAS
jgi:hypothetical protein